MPSSTPTTSARGGSTGVFLAGVIDHVLWYAKNTEHTKYRALYGTKGLGEEGADKYSRVRLPDLQCRSLTVAERSLEVELPTGARVYRQATSRAKVLAWTKAKVPHHGFR